MARTRRRGKTLWQMITDWLAHPAELVHYNPLKARIGNAVTVDTVELRDLNFFLYEIREYRRRIGRHEFLFADYVIRARPLEGEDHLYRLRLNPVGEDGRRAGRHHDVLLLRLDDEMPYDRDFYAVLTDKTNKFQVLEDGKVVEEFWRINDVSRPYRARVAVVRDTDQNGKAERSEVERFELDYWDYWREVPDLAGQPMLEFLFVEMDKEDGWFQIWRGEEIDPKRVLMM